MASREETAFLNWEFGHSERWPVECAFTASPASPEEYLATRVAFQRWVDIQDGPSPQIKLNGIVGTLVLENRGALRSLRRWLDPDSRLAFVARLQLESPHLQQSAGELQLTRTALPCAIEGAPTISFDLGAREKSDDVNRALSSWAKKSFFTIGERTFMLMTMPLLGNSQQAITILLDDGSRLLCELCPAGMGEFLRVLEWQKGNPDEPMARLVEVSGRPSFVDAAPTEVTTSLAGLVPRMPSELEYWLQYERFEAERDEGLLERRRQVLLQYDQVVPIPEDGTYRVRIINGGSALEAWSADGATASGSRGKQVDISVGLLALEQDPDLLEARMLELGNDSSGNTYACLKLKNTSRHPHDKGKIEPLETWGDGLERRRRREAFERLVTGKTASPDLLRHLYMPGQVPGIDGKNLHQRPGGAALTYAQKEAVLGAAKEPALFVIQGPPGTGKTFVISEIIAELRHRHRSDDKRNDSRPFRILVASRQRDAVRNLCDSLSKNSDSAEVFIDEKLFDSDQKERLIGVLKSRASDLAEQRANQPGFARYGHLLEAASLLRNITAAIRSDAKDGGQEVYSQLREFDSHPAAAALTDSLRQDLRALLEDQPTREEQLPQGGQAAISDSYEKVQSALEKLKQLATTPTQQAAELAIGELDQIEAVEGDLGMIDLSVLREWSGLLRVKLERAIDRARLSASDIAYWGNIPVLEPLEAAPSVGSTSNPQRMNSKVFNWVSRVGVTVKEELAELDKTVDGVLYKWVRQLREEPLAMLKVLESHAPIEAKTTSRSALAIGKEDGVGKFDVVIIDEAARSGLDVLIPMTLGRSIILVGDDRQLPPYVEVDLEKQIERGILENLSTEHAPSLFEYLKERLPRRNFVVLDVQRRMHEDIGNLVSRVFYEPNGVKLKNYYEGSLRGERAPNFGLFGDSPIVWVDTQDHPTESSIFGGSPSSGYESNRYEQEMVERLLTQIEPRLGGISDTSKPVGVITFYGNQKDQLDALVARHQWQRWVEVGTVDSFQGKEYPLVILSCVRSNPKASVGFLSKLSHRINVAFSRAQRQLIILGDSKTLCHPEKGSKWLRESYNLIANGSIPGRLILSREVFNG